MTGGAFDYSSGIEIKSVFSFTTGWTVKAEVNIKN
jgi:hypothetical protein